MQSTDSLEHDLRRELICTAWAEPARLVVRQSAVPIAGPGQVLVRVEATSVNPIDAKRAAGYGKRLLGLKRAATLPVVLGNDFAGVVEAWGSGVSAFEIGERVFGVVATGRGGGAHASHVIVPQEQLVRVLGHASSASLAVLPYSFTTMWLAVASTGLQRANAAGKRVLINGANGGLGRLAMHVLREWGCRVTAICATGTRDDCLALGAELAIERSADAIASLPDLFDVVLNFGGWDDEALLASLLKSDALGHATTVHPLLANFDRFGWLRGALASRREWKRMRSRVAAHAPNARYAWTVFRPDRAALDALAQLVASRPFGLPVGLAVPFEQASAAFEHIVRGRPGRAVLLPA
ncbi:MAG TPA: alcohol dehydrogenase catalytic domain-containing protein [Caldimonas sp.]